LARAADCGYEWENHTPKAQARPMAVADPIAETRRSVDSVELMLQKATQTLGHLYGVEISVRRAESNGPHGAELIFVDSDNDPIADDGEAILACTAEEIASGDFLKLFAARALYAALAQRFYENET
jgi:hypothetical protein